MKPLPTDLDKPHVIFDRYCGKANGSKLSRSSRQVRILIMAVLLFEGCSSLAGHKTGMQHDLSGAVRAEGVDPDKSALLIVRLEDGAEWTSGGRRIETAYPPASTSKIPHTFIALETGYAAGPDAFFKWDGTRRFFAPWNQDQTLASAYRYSAVWVYQQITRDLGYDTMSKWINRFEYGNRNIGSPDSLTRYWLVGPLETSARDQVRFLGKVANETLPLSPETVRVGKQIMQADRGDNWILYAKSGWRADGANIDIGWYVGWVVQVESGRKQTYVFAFNLDMADAADRARRQAVVRSALSQLGVATSVGDH